MAYVNGKFEHPDYEIIIEVLEPTKDEARYSEGMRVMVDWDSFADMGLEDLKSVIKWMEEKAEFIGKHFDNKGKIKQLIIKG